MNKISRTITGTIFIILGIFLITLSFFLHEAQWVPLIYGIPFLIIGIFIFFNKKEDNIERRKDMKGGKK